jgi:hypothetical protein
VLLTLAAWSHAQTAVQARLLLDDEAMAHCAVYVVDIERKGSDTRGELVAELPGNGARSTRWIWLPTPASGSTCLCRAINRARRFRRRGAALARRGRRAR